MHRTGTAKPMRLRTRMAGALCIVTAVMACSENTESQNLNDRQHLWPALGSAPTAALTVTNFGPQQPAPASGASLGPVLTDILAHLPVAYGSKYYNAELSTWGHETSHGIHDHLRNRHNTTGRKAAGFYLLSDKAAVVAEPKILKRRLAEFIPVDLQGPNFTLHITGQTVWDDSPLYVLDEFFGHLNGAAIALDAKVAPAASGDPSTLMEFTAYSIALAMAVQAYDPAYFSENHQFSGLIALAIERAMLICRLTAADSASAHQNTPMQRIHTTLTASAAGAPFMDFVRRLFGDDWTNRVLLAPLAGYQAPKEDLMTLLDATLPKTADSEADRDGDGISDRLDRCQDTPAGKAKVWTYGEWIGCAEGEQRN